MPTTRGRGTLFFPGGWQLQCCSRNLEANFVKLKTSQLPMLVHCLSRAAVVHSNPKMYKDAFLYAFSIVWEMNLTRMIKNMNQSIYFTIEISIKLPTWFAEAWKHGGRLIPILDPIPRDVGRGSKGGGCV